MMWLLRHPSADVRLEAARALLPYRPRESLDVLRTEASGEGSLAWVASQSIKKWENGAYRMDSGGEVAVGAGQAGAHDGGMARAAGEPASEEVGPDMKRAVARWDRVATDFFGPNPGAGDRAAAVMVLAHGFILDGGVLHAAEVLDQTQLEAARAGYRYFGFDGVADLLSRVKSLLDRPPSVHEGGTDLKVEVLPGATLMYEEEGLGQFEEQLDAEYRRHVPDDSALEERFEEVLAARPGDFTGF